MSVVGAATGDLRSRIHDSLDRQGDLSAVERFTRRHDSLEPSEFQQRTYRDLVPLSRPGAGEQYGFEVDLDVCSGCKACVAACHELNGLAPGENWRQVGLLVGNRPEGAFLQHVTTACHHCVDPACAKGCPASAYEKDAATGIVIHLDDQCIGCRYCTLTCPYEVPKYNAELGIVRKCDLCHGRLAANEAPACVQSCPNQAIRVAVVSQASLVGRRTDDFLPGAPRPDLTAPATVYRSARGLPADTVPADLHELREGDGHPPLVAMLVLTQLSVGAFLVGRAVEPLARGLFAPVRPVHAVVAVLAGVVALGVSTLHLGRPLQAWRALLGLRTSWLSREILAFGVFAGLAFAYAAMLRLLPGSQMLEPLGAAVVAVGLGGIFCSVMVYQVTSRAFWSGGPTALRFFGSALLLGVSATLFAGLLAAAVSPSLSIASFLAGPGRGLCGALAITTAAKLAFEATIFRHLRSRRDASDAAASLRATASLMVGPLQSATIARFLLGAIGGVLVPLLFSADVIRGGEPLPLAVAISLVFAFSLAGEIYERQLFFRAVTAARMPGGIPA
jgi:Fe-S-cluster-containing dehydrogenase component/DMSO reductase anchor subunit